MRPSLLIINMREAISGDGGSREFGGHAFSSIYDQTGLGVE